VTGQVPVPLTPAERERDRYLRATYNITLGEYNVILAFQGGVCALCGRPPGKRALHVDHDHRTRRTRGLLCFSCNYKIIGRVRDPEVFRRAARYLERPPADEALLAT
jgi:hypothetical protein